MYYVYCGNGCAYSNEMYHSRLTNAIARAGGNVRREGSKYIEKIKTDWGNRYFYTQEELNAYLNKAKRGIRNATGVTAKNNYERAKVHTQRARNYLEGSRHASANSGFSRTERTRLNNALDTYSRRLDQERSAKKEYDSSLVGRFDHFVENASVTITDLRSRASSYISQGKAKVQSMLGSAQIRVTELLSAAKNKASEYGSAAVAKAKKYYEKGKKMLTELFAKIRTKYRMATGKQQYEDSIGPKQREVQGPPSRSRDQVDQQFWEEQKKKRDNRTRALVRASGRR